MTTSILDSVKQHVNVMSGFDFFDSQLITFINSAFFQLNQLGVGPDTPFTISGSEAVWTDFIEEGLMEQVKAYVPLYVKLLFDPPSSSYLVDQLSKTLKEMEFRLQVESQRGLIDEPNMTEIYGE